MTDEQTKAIRDAAASMHGAASFLRSDRESADIRNIRWAAEKLEAAGLGNASGLIAAAIKAYEQGNDRMAASHAAAAGEYLDGLLPSA